MSGRGANGNGAFSGHPRSSFPPCRHPRITTGFMLRAPLLGRGCGANSRSVGRRGVDLPLGPSVGALWDRALAPSGTPPCAG